MSERFDLYASIHKALRNYMSAALFQLGRLDLNDEPEVRRCSEALHGLVDWLEAHVHLEEHFVHRALAERRSDALLTTLRAEHEQQERGFRMLRGDARRLVASLGEPMPTRRARARQLYLALSRFVAENFLHMAAEESEMNLLLWASFTDAELFEIYRNIIASEAPEQLDLGMVWLLPAIPPDDRVAVVGGARALLAAPVFEQLARRLRNTLGERDYAKLASALGLHDAA